MSMFSTLLFADCDMIALIAKEEAKLSNENGIFLDQFDFAVISRDEAPIEYPSCSGLDNKIFTSEYNWVFFPRLTQQGVSDDEIFEQVYYENEGQDLLHETSNEGSTITGFILSMVIEISMI